MPQTGLSINRNGQRRLSYLKAPRHRPLLTPPNNGKQKRNRVYLKVALKLGAGHWDLTMAANLRGMFLCTKSVLPGMKTHNCGWIINICSIGGRLSPNGNNCAYRTSKFGVRGFTWTLAKDVKDDNIAVSAILPGTTRSAMIANEDGDTSYWLEPKDIAEAALFLATRDTKVIIPEMTVAPRFTIGGLECPYS